MPDTGSLSVDDAIQSVTQGKSNSAAIKRDAEYLLSKLVDRPLAWLLSHGDEKLNGEQASQFRQWMDRCLAGEPLGYILGYESFMDLQLTVNQDVLIPRPETELLVEAVLGHCQGLEKQQDSLQILDMGCGSGAIGLALASRLPTAAITLADASSKALSVTRHNALALQLKNTRIINSNWFKSIDPFRYDVIVSNPPYIDPDDDSMEESVRRYEPSVALLAGENGLQDLRIIIQQAPDFLQTGGLLAVEHGYAQAVDVQHFFSQSGFTNIATENDYAGHHRMTLGFRR